MANQEISITPGKSDNVKPTAEMNMGARKPDLSQEVKNIEPKDILDYIVSKSPDDFLPWEKVNLPSMGLFYEGKIPNGTVEVRPMGLITDKILATSRLAQTGQSINYLYKHCVKFPDPNFDPLDLLESDRTFLLWYLRGITHGNIYEFSVTCNNDACKSVSTHEYDLNQLASTIKSPKFNREPFRIVLPNMSEILKREIYVECRFMRGRDLQIMMKSQENKKRMQGNVARNPKTGTPMASSEEITLDTTVEENLNLLIVSFNGNTDRFKINQVFPRMSSADTAVIRETIRESEPGVDTTILITCPNCSNEMKLGLPFTESFFRPTQPLRT